MKYFFLLLLTFLSVSIYGYGYGINANHAQMLPFIHYLNNPLLYQNDVYVQTFSSYPTFYCYLMAYLSKIIPLPVLHFILYLITKYFLLLAVFYLAKHLFSSYRTGLLACFLFALSPLVNLFTLLGEDPLMRSYLYQTSLVAPYAVLAILFFLKRKYFISFVLLAFIYYINGLIGTFILILFIFGTYKAERDIWRNWAVFLILWIPWLLWYIGLPNVNSGPTAGFISILKAWYPGHYFPSHWSFDRWKNLTVYLIYFFLFFKFGFKNAKKSIDIQPFIAAILTLWSMAFVFGEFIPVRQIILLQFFRSDILFISLGLVFAADYIRRYVDSGRLECISLAGLLLLVFTEGLPPFYALPVLILLLFFFLPYKIYFKISTFIFLILCVLDIFSDPIFLKKILVVSLFLSFILISKSKENLMISKKRLSYIILPFLVMVPYMAIIQYRITTHDFLSDSILEERLGGGDFKALQCWVEKNTFVTAKFITPPYRTGFRVFSKRSTFVEWIDGAAMHWSPGFEKEWVKRLNELGYDIDAISFLRQGLGTSSEPIALKIKNIYASVKKGRFLKLAKRYGIDYVVEENKYNSGLDFPIVYRNDTFSLYKVAAN